MLVGIGAPVTRPQVKNSQNGINYNWQGDTRHETTLVCNLLLSISIILQYWIG